MGQFLPKVRKVSALLGSSETKVKRKKCKTKRKVISSKRTLQK